MLEAMTNDKHTKAVAAIRGAKTPENLIVRCRQARDSGVLSRNQVKALKRKESKRIGAGGLVLA